MRKWILTLVAAFSLGAALAAAPAAVVVLDAENMTCPACGITIKKALEKVPGVTDTKVDTRAETVTVTFDSGQTDTSAIAHAVTEAGFPATARTDGE
ncbi:heavy-metal-associated domain-containing protein [Luteimonas qiangzhengi]|jgi:mercuric ion binding protein|uniref:heavy-metal-associated domain-containing protein n=1 Tax=Luteimonas sp. MJ146 TaxID=3129240 RepID=UPI0031BB1CD9